MTTEKRYIDANDALERLQKAEREMKVVSVVGCKAVPIEGVIEFIQSIHTVDAVEVVHGRWLWHDDEFEYVCSACKCRFDYNHTFGIFDHDYEYGNYCPNCGAKMDGDGNE